MKPIRLLLAAALLAVLTVGDAAAHGGGHRHFRGPHFSFLVGPLWWGSWYRPYYPPVVVEQGPPIYIEREPDAAAPSAYWYYCSGAKGYYPYVRECPGGWLKVPPRPADER